MATGRRGFLRALAGAPVAGYMVLNAPHVVEGASGIALPSKDIATPLAQPLVLATEMPPAIVEPIDAFVLNSTFRIERMTLDDVRFGDIHRAVTLGPATVRVSLDLELFAPTMSRSQLEAIMYPTGRGIKLYVEPA